jgi:hypothetical protein
VEETPQVVELGQRKPVGEVRSQRPRRTHEMRLPFPQESYAVAAAGAGGGIATFTLDNAIAVSVASERCNQIGGTRWLTSPQEQIDDPSTRDGPVSRGSGEIASHGLLPRE